MSGSTRRRAAALCVAICVLILTMVLFARAALFDPAALEAVPADEILPVMAVLADTSATSVCLLGPYMSATSARNGVPPKFSQHMAHDTVPEGEVRVVLFDQTGKIASRHDMSRYPGPLQVSADIPNGAACAPTENTSIRVTRTPKGTAVLFMFE